MSDPLERNTIYEDCVYCEQGKIKELPRKDKIVVIASAIAMAIPLFFLLGAITRIVGLKLANESVPLKSPLMTQSFLSALVLIALGIVAHYRFNVLRRARAWFTKLCPHCEDGYIIKDRAGLTRAILYFLDIFLFEQILLPMFRTLTFQRFWKGEKKEKGWAVAGKLILYAFLFFGSVPFLVFLLGNNKIIGLVFALMAMTYLLYMIFSSNEEEQDYQKSIIFLMIPLYYVSMVEIFRWAWVLSPGSLLNVPDQSDFLYMGLENLIRTQLFMDLFEVYEVRIGDIEATSFLAHSAIFLTRILLDIAMISLLIRAAVDSFRRTWIYHHTGRKIQKVTDTEALLNIENLAIVGKPTSIHEVKDNLEQVKKVLGFIKPYVSSVAGVSTDEESRQAAQECAEVIEKVSPPLSEDESRPLPPISFKDRLLASLCVAAWAVLFTIGIHYFIQEVTAREIRWLMQEASSEKVKNDPITRRDLYLKVLKKDARHQEAMIRCAATYMELGELNTRLLDLDRALIDIDKGFQHAIELQKIVGLQENPFTSRLSEAEAKAYLIRGKIFFLKNDFDRAISELRKIKNQEIRRALCNMYLYRACERMFEKSEGAGSDPIQTAEIELGFDPQYEFSYYLPLVKALSDATRKNIDGVIAAMEEAVRNEHWKSGEVRSLFGNWFALSLMNKGKDSYLRSGQELGALLKANLNDYDAWLGDANLKRLQGKPDVAAKLLLQMLEKDDCPDFLLKRARVHLVVALLQQDDRSGAASHVRRAVESFPIRERFREALPSFLEGKMDKEGFLDAAWSWDFDVAHLQESLAWFYLGADFLGRKKFEEAGDAFRRCLFFKKEETVEYLQALQEMDNLQILEEGRVYLLESFFRPDRIASLRDKVREELRKIILPESETEQGLSFVLETRYEKEKQRGIAAVVREKALSEHRLLPLLKKAMQSKDDDVQLAALEGLSTLGGLSYEAQEEVMKALESENEAVRRASVKVMSRFGKEAVEALSKALQDKDKYVRRDAAYALSALGKEAASALPILSKKMYDEEVMVRDAAFAAVKQTGEIGVPALSQLILNSKDTMLRVYAIREISSGYPEVLRQIRNDIIPVLVEMLTGDPDPQSRRWAAMRLVLLDAEDRFLDKEKVVPELLQRMKESLQDSDPKRRLGAANAYLLCVERWGGDARPAFEVIETRLLQGDLKDRSNVVSFLIDKANVTGQTAKLFCDLLTSENLSLQGFAQRAIQALIKSDSFPVVAGKLVGELSTLVEKSKSKKVKEVAKDLIKRCGDEAFEVAAPVLVPLLIHAHAPLREVGAEALKLEDVNPDYVLESGKQTLLVEAIKTSPLEVQKSVLNAAYVFKLKHAELLPVLLKLGENQDLKLAALAVRTLSWFTEEKETIRPALEKSLKKTLGAKKEDDEESGEGEEESGEEEGESPERELQKAILFTLGVFDGVDALFQRCEKNFVLQEALIPVIEEIMVHQKEPMEKTALALSRFLRSKNPDIVLAALEQLSLVSGGLAAVLPDLKELQNSKNKEIRKQAGQLHFKASPPQKPEEIVPWLSHGDPEIRLAAMKAIRSFDAKSLPVDPFVLRLGDGVPAIASESTRILAQMHPTSIPSLLWALDHKNASVQINGMKALGLMGSKAREAVKKLVEKLADKNPKIAEAALEQLSRIVQEEDKGLVAREVQKILREEKADKKKIDALVIVHHIGYPSRSLPELIKMLEDPSKDTKYLLSRMMDIAPKQTLSYLCEKLRERYGKPGILDAIGLLAQMGPQASPAVGYLQDLTYDSNPLVSSEAASALRQITGEKK